MVRTVCAWPSRGHGSEATGIRDVRSGPLLRIGDDRFLPGLRSLVRTVDRASGGYTQLFIQLIDFMAIRRRPEPRRYFAEYLTITTAHRQAFACAMAGAGAPVAATGEAEVRAWLGALPRAKIEQVLSPRELEGLDMGVRERVTDCLLPQVRALPLSLPRDFAAAARRNGFHLAFPRRQA